MIKETMTAEQRVLAAINLEPYDRVPVAPHPSVEFPLAHKGKSLAVTESPQRWDEFLHDWLDLYDEVGGWDGVTIGGRATWAGFTTTAGGAGSMRYPGQDQRVDTAGSVQFEEREMLSAEDYDDIIKLGWARFVETKFSHIRRGGFITSVSNKATTARLLTDQYLRSRDAWQKRGVGVIAGVMSLDPQMALSLMRTFPQFTLDLYRRPDKVQAALDAMVDDFIKDGIEGMRLTGISSTGIPGVNVACERGSGEYYNLKIFERFVWPYIKKMVETWAAAGIVTTLHFDTNWTLNLPYLKELPRKMCICQLDSKTDIFKAKEILKDHMCIMGDVPPALSSHGTPEQMEAYCRKLIDVVGRDTGFILSNGCAVPPDTKYENFKMMIDTARNYPPSRSS
ncbi:MAG: uroporphyrinogen decarboxylase family protein [Dehalococcoidia bacterium]|nr:uroporphyrinogen decarboxylase family protein [Dehalococcoidia bacterium]